jgi:hypothetical protein
MAKQARILTTVELDGQTYQPNQIVEFTDKTAKALHTDGQVDTDPAAVAYCTKELGIVVIKHIAVEVAAESESAADDLIA